LSSFLLVFSTAPSVKSAKKLARLLCEKRLAACVNVVPSLTSFFWWQGKIDCASEALLLIKTKKTFFRKLERFLKAQHPYDVPEIIALPIEAGEKSYLDWLSSELSRSRRK